MKHFTTSNTTANNNLETILETTKKSILKDFSDDNLAKIKTEEIGKRLQRFKKSEVAQVVGEIDHAIEVFKSPVHIGEIGAYSSGKSALLNALYMLEPECRQPEGEGVVTSKVTYVSFRSDVDIPEAYEIRKDGSQRRIELSMLQKSVGRSDVDNSVVDYYKIILPTNQKDFAEQFAKQNINLIDMPGYGGPYFNDQVLTRRYLRELDMLLVIVRADKIHQAGVYINSLIESTTVPIIPVLTFYDLCQNSDLYMDCNSDEEIIVKAKSLIRQEIPSLIPYIDYLVPVSSKTGQNISELRCLILNHIESSNIAISKSRKDISPVRRRQIAEFKVTNADLNVKLEGLSASLKDMMNSIVPDPKSVKKSIVSKAQANFRVTKANRALNDNMSKGFNDLSSRYRDRLATLLSPTNADALMAEVDRIEKDVNDNLFRDWFERVSGAYQTYKDELSSEIQSSINSMALDFKTRDSLIQNVETVMEYSTLEMGSDLKIHADKNRLAGMRVQEQAKNTLNFITSYLKNPSCWMMGLIGVLLLSITALPFGLAKFTGIGGIVCIGISLVTFVLQNGNQKKQFFYETRQKTYDYMCSLFDSTAFRDNIKATVESTKIQLCSDIENVLNEDISSYNRDSELLGRIKENVDTAVCDLSEQLKDEICELASMSIR